LARTEALLKNNTEGYVRTVAGDIKPGYKDGIGKEAGFRSIEGLAVYGDFLYITD
jgi:hypothetical protein